MSKLQATLKFLEQVRREREHKSNEKQALAHRAQPRPVPPPRTAAGRDFLYDDEPLTEEGLLNAVLAIEAEAAAPTPADPLTDNQRAAYAQQALLAAAPTPAEPSEFIQVATGPDYDEIPMTTPRTAAGRALLDLDLDALPDASDRAKAIFGRHWDMRAAILAIEAEAAAPTPDPLARTCAHGIAVDCEQCWWIRTHEHLFPLMAPDNAVCLADGCTVTRGRAAAPTPAREAEPRSEDEDE